MHQHHAGREKPGAHRPRTHLGLRLLRVLVHVLRIPVDTRILPAQKLVDHSGHALLPALPVALYLPDGAPLVEKLIPDRKTEGHGQTVKLGQHGRP